MKLVLSMVSSRGLWLLVDSQGQEVSSAVWEDEAKGNLWKDMESQMDRVLAESGRSLQELDTLFCVNGPGSFTGLRISASYMKGLAMARNLPLRPIPSLDLSQKKSLFIPVRQQLAKQLSLEECLERKLEFLKLEKDSVELCTPALSDFCWGLKDSVPLWPRVDDLLAAARKNFDSEIPFEINYGIGAKVSGKYTS